MFSWLKNSSRRYQVQFTRLRSTWEGFIDEYNLVQSEKIDIRKNFIANQLSKDVEFTESDLLKNFARKRGSLSIAFTLREDFHAITQDFKKSSVNSDQSKLMMKSVKNLDKILQKWLGFVMSVDSLDFHRIQFETSSGSTLERIARGESVHRVRSLDELKRRLHDGKRCFALIHHALPDQPLIFIHVALTTTLCKSISQLDAYKAEQNPTHAMFYSINSPYAALRGLDMASILIKEVVAHIQSTYPTVKTFSTLSPIPQFSKWVQVTAKDSKKTSLKLPDMIFNELQAAFKIIGYESNLENQPQSYFPVISTVLSDPMWTRNTEFVNAIKRPLSYIAAHYIAHEKIVDEEEKMIYPKDDVARFHLRNGAIFHAINHLGNPSHHGLSSSFGLMVNYLYDLELVEKNAVEFGTKHELPLGSEVVELLH